MSLPEQKRFHEDSHFLERETETWLARIRERLPEAGTAVATTHRLPTDEYLISFRASAFGETLLTEVRERSQFEGLRKAGRLLVERLTIEPPAPRKKPFVELMREIFE